MNRASQATDGPQGVGGRAELTTCLTDPMCDCALGFYLSGAEPADCFLMCGASPPALELFNCAAPACEGTCQ